ncbi:Lrp/AsnC family transcriptional regulator [Mycolicibacterium baixiangningiae]|uniref:Lrp/AsnC family transcriptional regulator n=1 Tax=Mycolicibacterium baixiangningiae TaxID=2761578 RepID=UPI0018D1E705|nr:Lrp/AsnC family transcriptional regulator [Mycolicibacterium baixiangningiae]
MATGDADGGHDPQSAAIIGMLREDGRRSYSSIAKEVGLSEAAVRQRVQRLIEQGQMQIVAITIPLDEFKLSSLLQISVKGDLRATAAQIGAIPEVSFCAIVSGDCHVVAEVMCRDGRHLLTVVHESIEAVPAVTEVRTLVYLEVVKQTYQWGTWPLGEQFSGTAT